MIPSTVHLWHFVLFIRSASSSKQLIGSSKLNCDLISNDNFSLTFCHQTLAKYNWRAKEMDRWGYKKKTNVPSACWIKMSICWWIFYLGVDRMSNVSLQILESFWKAIHLHSEFHRFLLLFPFFYFLNFFFFFWNTNILPSKSIALSHRNVANWMKCTRLMLKIGSKSAQKCGYQ